MQSRRKLLWISSWGVMLHTWCNHTKKLFIPDFHYGQKGSSLWFVQSWKLNEYISISRSQQLLYQANQLCIYTLLLQGKYYFVCTLSVAKHITKPWTVQETVTKIQEVRARHLPYTSRRGAQGTTNALLTHAEKVPNLHPVVLEGETS